MFPIPENELYLKRYFKLIEYSKTKSYSFVEKHHILPKCLGGSNEKNNIIKLSPRIHFLVHYLLSKAYPNNRKLKHAFAMMMVNNMYQNRKSKLYELARIARSEALLGVPRTKETIQKLRKPKNNKINYKKPKTKEHALNISKSNKGRVHKRACCLYCKKEASVTNLARWHYKNNLLS